ncbi:methyl-accepting chemotaxis protein [Sphingomonas sp. IC4-52]|uniref:methyl-accepting chemotaxis protein n=1 Tax=Sphingomonas sp. IC4-52 TaxID=2887202 RepID=UPI001D12D53C|nr:methyl-accepting chemotaxis protein [Sphingomonas sp. IC4-52]MCC2981342.1 methyl-accepting chemotaxis protein [Sphingomonas sp. IC4-52]
MTGGIGKLPLATKTTFITILSLIVLAIATFLVSDRTLTSDAQRVAAERQETNMRVAWSVLRQQGSSFRREGDKLYVGNRLLNGWSAPVDEVKRLVGGTATIFSGDQRVSTNVIKADGTRAVGTPLAAGQARDMVLGEGKPFRGEADILGQPYFTAYDPIRDDSGNVIGILYVGIPKEEVLSAIKSVRTSMAVAAFIIALIATIVSLFLTRAMFRPLTQMNRAMQTLAAGGTDTAIPGIGRGDEIGRMAQALENFRDALLARKAAEASNAAAEAGRERMMSLLSHSLSGLSTGDLTVDVPADVPAEYRSLAQNFNAALAKLRELVAAVRMSTDAIRTGSNEIASASEDLARRTESNAASLEETSAAITQMTERAASTASAASATVVRAGGATEAVATGRETVDEAVQAMTRVAESAKGIDTVIEGLDKIAFQTRVLAMNAAVEAGRAGEAGRGFAVVADLVSALAMRAEEEARRAREQLTVTQDEVVVAVGAVQRVDGSLDQISRSVAVQWPIRRFRRWAGCRKAPKASTA